MKLTHVMAAAAILASGAAFTANAQEDIHQDVVLKSNTMKDCACCKKHMGKDMMKKHGKMMHDKSMHKNGMMKDQMGKHSMMKTHSHSLYDLHDPYAT